MANRHKILLVGTAFSHERVPSFARTFHDNGHETCIIDIRQHYRIGIFNRVFNRIRRVPMYFGVGKLNKKILSVAGEFRPDFILFVKPTLVRPETLRTLKAKKIVLFSWYPDDIFYSKNASTYFYASIPLYDAHFSTKTFNMEELLEGGAKRAEFSPHAVDSYLFYPTEPTEGEQRQLGADVVFVGTYEKERARMLEQLCAEGYDVRIYGNGWGRCTLCTCLKEKRCIMGREVIAEEMSKVFNASKIVLAFLRKHNRDLQTARTYEVPACGGFMLHERTDEAAALFEEGKEADFFESFGELKEKIDFYLAHPEERKRIAQAGYERASSSEYSYRARTEKILKVFREMART